MTTGARRGEVCGLQWKHVDLETATITIRRTIYVDTQGQLQEKDTKTHQQRRVVLDAETAAVLRERRARAAAQAEALGSSLQPDCYIFSGDPEGRVPTNPDSVTQRYKRMANSLKNARPPRVSAGRWREELRVELVYPADEDARDPSKAPDPAFERTRAPSAFSRPVRWGPWSAHGAAG